jgi:hypothetical protein
LIVTSPNQLGHWTVTASGPEGAILTLGFSVNLPDSEMQLTPVKAAELDSMLGQDKYALADELSGFKRVVDRVRYGREIFPWIMAIILLLVTLENLLANTFYREGTTAKGETGVSGGKLTGSLLGRTVKQV